MSFNKGSGTTATGIGGSITNMTTSDWSVETPLGTGYSFASDNVAKSVTLGWHYKNINDALSASLWINHTALTGQERYLFVYCGSGALYRFVLNSGGQLMLQYYDGASYTDLFQINNFRDNLQEGQWHHLAYTFDESFGAFYLDGEEQARFTPAQALACPGGKIDRVRIADGNAPNGVTGFIDDVMVWPALYNDN